MDTTPRTYSGAFIAAVAIALLAALGSLIWAWSLSGKIAAQQTELQETKQRNVELSADLRETNAKLRVTADELGKSLGLTQKQMDDRARQIVAREEAENKRLESAQKETAQQVSAVATDVSSVKTDVGGVKTDLGKTQTDLAGAISKLTTMQGDLSGHSSLIARNHDELEVLKHKGDRTFYEFTLTKGDRKPVGTVSLELKKTDAKKNKFTLVVCMPTTSVTRRRTAT